MIKDLIANASLLVAFMFLGGEIFKNNNFTLKAPIKVKIFGGIIGGILGSLLMLFSVNIHSNIMLDLRHFAIIVVSIYGGFISSIIASIIMGLFRIGYFGVNSVSIIALFLLITIGILCGLIAQSNISVVKKWIYNNAICIILTDIALVITLKESSTLINTIIYFSIISILVGLLTHYLSNHIVISNALYMKYKVESTKDFLTGLNNVRNFDMIFNETIDKVLVNNNKLSILVLDIDHFKKINDTYGHLSGDSVLKELSDLLNNACRGMDTVSRLGGEEFCFLLPNCDIKEALSVAERIRKTVEKNKFKILNKKEIKITVSIGVSSYPDTVKDINNIIEQADCALYKAKQLGRNKVCSITSNSVCHKGLTK